MRVIKIVKPVIKWRKAFNLPIRDRITFTNEDEIELAFELIHEEMDEFKDAVTKEEKVDALTDLIYVCTQFLNVVGVNLHIESVTDETMELTKLYDMFVQTLNSDDKVKSIFPVIDMLALSYEMLKEYGNPDDFIKEVYRSNMTKLCKTKDEAERSVESYRDRNVMTHYKKVGKNYIIYRSSDDKILKGINYDEPSLTKFIKKS